MSRHPNRSTLNRRRPSPLGWALALALAAGPIPAATIVVNSDSDADIDDANCSLREAIIAANVDIAYHGCAAGSGADQVTFALGPSATIVGSVSGLPTITGSLTLVGPGADQLTIDGADLQPLFLVDSPAGGVGFQAQDLTLANGNAFTFAMNRGGAVTVREGDLAVFRRVVFRDHYSELAGGAILLLGESGAPALVTIEDCLFEGNEGEIFGGGAIFAHRSVLDVKRSTFTANQTDSEPAGGQGRGGGAILARDGSLVVRSSTFSGNTTRGSGGALLVLSEDATIPDSFTLDDSTVVGNVGDSDGDDVGNVGGIAIAAFPGHSFAVEMQNNLVAGNTDSGASIFPDVLVSGTGITSNGFNLIGKNPGMTSWFPTGLPNVNFDYVGTVAAPLTAALTPLADWGGPTPVHLPLLTPGNLAVDRGDCAVDAADQRGFVNAATGLRPYDDPLAPNGAGSDGCDIGAAEAGATAASDLPFADGFESGTTGNWSSSVGN